MRRHQQTAHCTCSRCPPRARARGIMARRSSRSRASCVRATRSCPSTRQWAHVGANRQGSMARHLRRLRLVGRPVVVKMDIEGGELDVIRATPASVWQHVVCLVVELRDLHTAETTKRAVEVDANASRWLAPRGRHRRAAARTCPVAWNSRGTRSPPADDRADVSGKALLHVHEIPGLMQTLAVRRERRRDLAAAARANPRKVPAVCVPCITNQQAGQPPATTPPPRRRTSIRGRG